MKLQTKNFKFVNSIDFTETYTDDNGAIRWISSDNVPPIDMMELAFVEGKISEQTLTTSLKIKEQDDETFIRAYVANRQKHGYSKEELAEIEANFGPDETVVDFFTGQVLKQGA